MIEFTYCTNVLIPSLDFCLESSDGFIILKEKNWLDCLGDNQALEPIQSSQKEEIPYYGVSQFWI